MTESTIVKQIMSYLRSQGFYVFKISDRFRSGIPDLYCCRHGKSYWFEVKTKIGKVSKLQEYEIEQLQAHGVPACVVRSVLDVVDVLQTEAK